MGRLGAPPGEDVTLVTAFEDQATAPVGPRRRGAGARWRARLAALLSPRPLIGAAAALAVTLGVVGGFRSLNSLESLEAGLNDRLRVILSPWSESQDPRLSVLTVTEDTLALFPYRSPVDRGFLADVIGVLGDAGAKAIGLDILIDQATEPEKDARLIAAIRAFDGPVVLAWADARAGLRPAQNAFLADFIARSGAIPGFATVLYDRDGVVRRFTVEEAGSPVRSFPAALIEATGGEARPDSGLIDWRRETADGSPAFQILPSQTVLNPAMPKALFTGWFGGRYVLIGADLEQTDRHQTSLAVDPTISNRTSPGVLLHAHVLSQLLDGREVLNIDVGGAGGAALVALMALLGVAVGISNRSPALKLGGLTLAAAAWLALAAWLSSMGGPYVPVAPTLLALGVAFGLGAAAEAFLSNRDKQFIRQAFSHYLEPAMVDRLARDRDSLRLGGEKREISFIFTDIAGFTEMSERLPPEKLTGLLNEYFDGLSDIIARHHGCIDKFIGDAVVALFGALTPEPDHAYDAIACAAEMDAFAEEFRRRHADLGLGITRIGVHTGVAAVGNFGGRKRFDYTAMGDAMNTAARLESINKRLGTRVTVSAAARAAAMRHAAGRDVPPMRRVGRVALKGKSGFLEVWNIDPAAPMDKAAAAAWAEALALMSRDPQAAARRLQGLADAAAAAGREDPLAALHLARLRAGEIGEEIV